MTFIFQEAWTEAAVLVCNTIRSIRFVYFQFIDSKTQSYQSIPNKVLLLYRSGIFLPRGLTWNYDRWKICHCWIFSCAIRLGSVRPFFFCMQKEMKFSLLTPSIRASWKTYDSKQCLIFLPGCRCCWRHVCLSRFPPWSTFALGTCHGHFSEFQPIPEGADRPFYEQRISSCITVYHVVWCFIADT